MFKDKKLIERIQKLEDAMEEVTKKAFLNELFEYTKMDSYDLWRGSYKQSVVKRLNRQVALILKHFGLQETVIASVPEKSILTKKKQ